MVGRWLTAVGLSRKPETHLIARVIGNDPLRQFLVPFPGGRFQTLEASYDPHSNQWFNVYGDEDRQPGEWGHWTGRGMNWNSMCAACHNTRLRKNYDEATDTFRTAMAEMSVGCEACHWPLSAHNEWQNRFGNTGRKDPTLPKFTRAQVEQNCAFCHSLRTDLTGDFKPGDNFADDCQLLTADGSERYYADGQIRAEDYRVRFILGQPHAFAWRLLRGLPQSPFRQNHFARQLALPSLSWGRQQRRARHQSRYAQPSQGL